jgi:hypothetical protein
VEDKSERIQNGQRNDELVAHYERLRMDVLSVTTAHNAEGLALFLRNGMAAWMSAWSSCMRAVPRGVSAAQPSEATSPSPLNVRSQLAAIVAGMLLEQQLEMTK